MKIESALKLLNDLIESGYEFPEAVWVVVDSERLNDREQDLLTEMYDAQF